MANFARFTKANFEAIADLLAEAHTDRTPRGNQTDEKTILHIEGKLARLFEATNPRFDKAKFYKRIDARRGI